MRLHLVPDHVYLVVITARHEAGILAVGDDDEITISIDDTVFWQSGLPDRLYAAIRGDDIAELRAFGAPGGDRRVHLICHLMIVSLGLTKHDFVGRSGRAVRTKGRKHDRYGQKYLYGVQKWLRFALMGECLIEDR